MKKITLIYPLVILIIGLLFKIACSQPGNKTNGQTVKKHNISTKVPEPFTDSSKLLKHLDSLPKIKFPYDRNDGSNHWPPAINLSEFKDKKLFDNQFKPIPIELGGSSFDMDQPTNFNLADTVNYKAEWELIAKTSKFIVVKVNTEILVTLTYQLKVIDAIRSDAAKGNNHWSLTRHSTINKDLTIHLHHEWTMETDEQDRDDPEAGPEFDDQRWFIDQSGHFRIK